MLNLKTGLSLVMAMALIATGAYAAEAEHEQHHPTPPATAATQTPAMPGMPMGSMPGQSGNMPMMGMMQMMMGENVMAGHVEGRIAFLKTELKITEAQSPQWNQFAEALRANARRMTEMHEMMSQGGAAMNAPDRLDRMEKMMTGMLESVRTTKAALTPLYAVLTDEQKKLADDLIRGPMGVMGPV